MVLVAVCAAITLLPALLGIVGDHIDRLRIPLPHRKPDDKPHGWARWGRMVAAHPIPAALVALAILVTLALPVLDLYLGQEDDGAMPTSTDSRKAYDGLTAGFGAGTNGQFLISVDMSKQPAKADQKQIDQINSDEKDNKDKANKQAEQQEEQLEAQGMPADQAQAQVAAAADQAARPDLLEGVEPEEEGGEHGTDPRLQDLRDDLKKTSGVKSVTQPLVNKDGTAAVLNLTPTTAPSDEATANLVTKLRDDVIPKATKGKNMSADVGGTTAGYVDLASAISNKLIVTILVVVALSFVLLLLAFRSIVIPLTAGLMNLVSIGAAFGVVCAVFEKGWGASLVGLDGEVPIVSYVPLMMFAILFGLSMDYEVFLMTHIREHWLETHDNKESVIRGIATTGRVITSAALIMVSVFFAFILNGDPTVKQFGVGMGVAVAVDATVVRCLLVPAVMVLIGKANWWFPGWLDKIVPNFSIEGEDWFVERDKAAAAAQAAAADEPERVPT